MLPGAFTGDRRIHDRRDERAPSARRSRHAIAVPIWGSAAATPVPASLDELVAEHQRGADRRRRRREPFLAGATAQRIGNTIRVLPGPADPNISFDFAAAATATPLGLDAATARNVARYAPGIGVTALAQVAGPPGNNGTPPGAATSPASEAAKTGIYALENVDLFNLLVMPDATAGAGTDGRAHRGDRLLHAPARVHDHRRAGARSRRSRRRRRGSAARRSPLRSRNVGALLPAAARARSADEQHRRHASRPRARWPASTRAPTPSAACGRRRPAPPRPSSARPDCRTRSPTARTARSTRSASTACARSRCIGTVSWGARTARGADALADEYKYIPVRRLALFLEESLYRGTQWAVFEPNDEPLWAQIRLNLGAFMHTLFAQGAFQGRTPRDAYFVKCDKETTTQNDIDLGRVNIVVGFAPLKPAEFVIIQIQQIAGAIQT